MATLTCGYNPPIMPLNNRDTKALDDIFGGFEGDAIGEIDAALNGYCGSRRQSSKRQKK